MIDLHLIRDPAGRSKITITTMVLRTESECDELIGNIALLKAWLRGGVAGSIGTLTESQSVAASPVADAPRTDGAQGEAAHPAVSPPVQETSTASLEGANAGEAVASGSFLLSPAAIGKNASPTIHPGARPPASAEKQYPHAASHGEVIPEIASPPVSQSCAVEPSPAQEGEAAVANPAASLPNPATHVAGTNLTSNQYKVLAILIEAANAAGVVVARMKSGDLRTRAGISKDSIAPIIDRLNDKGYLRTEGAGPWGFAHRILKDQFGKPFSAAETRHQEKREEPRLAAALPADPPVRARPLPRAPERSEQPKPITEPLLKPSATEPRPSWAGKPDEKPEHDKALAEGFSMHVSFAGQWLTVGRTPYRITKPVAEVIGPLVKAQGRAISDGTLRTMLGRAPGPAVHDANLTLKGSPLEIVEKPDGYRLVERKREAAE